MVTQAPTWIQMAPSTIFCVGISVLLILKSWDIYGKKGLCLSIAYIATLVVAGAIVLRVTN